MRNGLIVLASVAALVSPAFASDFEAACMEGAPDGVDEAGAAEYCACLADETDGNEALRAELEASWPVTDIESWLADLSADAGNAAAACQP